MTGRTRCNCRRRQLGDSLPIPITLLSFCRPRTFRALPHITITVHNGHTNAAETYSGVPLATLLAKVNAPLGKELRGQAMTSYVIATGSDGYSVVLSLAEVDPSFHEGQVLVADTRDGQPLGNYGPFQLIVTDDKRPARWVHNLNSITAAACPLIILRSRSFERVLVLGLLLQSVDHVKVSERAAIAIHVGSCVGSH